MSSTRVGRSRFVVGCIILGATFVAVPTAIADATSEPLPASTPPTTTVVAPLATYSGEGTQVVETPGLPETEPLVMKVTFDGGEFDNITITEIDVSGTDSQVVNWYRGSFTGRFLMSIDSGWVRTEYLQVEADGSWTIELYPLLEAIEPRWTGGELHGVGPDVALFDGAHGVVSFAHNGEGNFIVKLYPVEGGRTTTLINEQDTVDGTVLLQDDIALLTINAGGEWWLNRS